MKLFGCFARAVPAAILQLSSLHLLAELGLALPVWRSDEFAAHRSLHAPYTGSLPPPRKRSRHRLAKSFLQVDPTGGGADGDRLGRVLYVVYSDSRFYSTRLKWVKDTWAKEIPKTDFAVVGDAPYNGSDVNVLATDCASHSHGEGGCCKLAHAVRFAYEQMEQDPTIKWTYFADDDVYVRPRLVEKALQDQPSDSEGRGVVLGILGCATPACTFSVCGGGGYAADRQAVYHAVAGSEDNMQAQQMVNCAKCSQWGDAAITQVYLEKQVEFRSLPGLYGWKLDKQKFDQSLSAKFEPIMYHYIQSQEQMNMLHALFTGEKLSSDAPADQAEELCASYKGRTECGLSGSPLDTPWLEVPRAQRAAWIQHFQSHG